MVTTLSEELLAIGKELLQHLDATVPTTCLCLRPPTKHRCIMCRARAAFQLAQIELARRPELVDELAGACRAFMQLPLDCEPAEFNGVEAQIARALCHYERRRAGERNEQEKSTGREDDPVSA